MSIFIYGIKNCDTMKKAFAWLDTHQIPYSFHDYKKSGIDIGILQQAIEQHGWENIINRKGTSWRALPENVKASMDKISAIQAAQDNPSLVRRPLLVDNGKIYVGFTADSYASIF